MSGKRDDLRIPTQVGPRGVQTQRAAPRTGGMVRPYVLTGGRTATNCVLDLHTLVSTKANLDLATTTVRHEQRSICVLCTSARSVAEVAALTKVPLGVARVLIADLIAAGLVTAGSTESADPSRDLMEKVLRGLHNL